MHYFKFQKRRSEPSAEVFKESQGMLSDSLGSPPAGNASASGGGWVGSHKLTRQGGLNAGHMALQGGCMEEGEENAAAASVAAHALLAGGTRGSGGGGGGGGGGPLRGGATKGPVKTVVRVRHARGGGGGGGDGDCAHRGGARGNKTQENGNDLKLHGNGGGDDVDTRISHRSWRRSPSWRLPRYSSLPHYEKGSVQQYRGTERC